MAKKEKFDVQTFVYDYPTKNKQGFTPAEMKDIVEKFPFEINQEKFDDAMMGNTCMMIDNEMIIYHCDIVTALRCGAEDRVMHWWEWD